jgi:hypothetical protein
VADRVGSLAIVISGDSKQFMEVMSGVEQHIAAAQRRSEAMAAKNSGMDVGGLFGMGKNAIMGAAGVAGIGLSAKAIWDSGQSALKAASDYETATAQLKSLTGSAGQAAVVMDELTQFASGTPFGIGEVSAAARKLMGTGIEQGKAIQATKQLAAVSAATGGELASLARAYGQVAANGRFMTEELNQFSDADFPIAEFAKTAGMSMAKLREDMSKGLVPVEVMSDTFTRLTAQGGKFSTALADMMKTSAGLAKQEESRHAKQMQQIGDQLKASGIGTGQSLSNLVEERLTASLAMVAHGVGYAASFDKRSFSDYLTTAMSPELTPEGIKQQRADFEAASLARRESDYERYKASPEAMAATDHLEALRLAHSMKMDLEQITATIKEGGDLLKTKLNRAIESMFANGDGMNPFRTNSSDMPKSFGFRDEMIRGDLDAAARSVQDMRANLASRARVQLPTAATFGSSAAADTINNAIAATMGTPLKDTADILKEMKKVEEEANKKLEDIKNDLRNLKVAKF